MLKKALQFTSDVLNQFLVNKFQLDDKKVILNNIIEADGSVPQVNQNKVVITLINIEKETARPFYVRNQKLDNGSFADRSLSEKYNLDILITSSFDNYLETLSFLNGVILFFQVNTFLDSTYSASFPQGLSKLEFEIEKLSYHQMHSLWSAMGAKYQPSVIYKLRLITLQGDEPVSFTGAVNQTSNSAVSQ